MKSIESQESATFRHPPRGSNADWDELLTGKSVEQQLIQRSLETLGQVGLGVRRKD